MAIFVSSGGAIHFYKGDTGNITFKGLPTDKNYSVYFAVSNPETNAIIGDELVVSSQMASTVTFAVPASFTDQFKVETGEDVAVLQYGLKICSGSDEYTLIPQVEINDNEPTFKTAPSVYVHKKYVEGTV